jgi:serine/threonine protein kinase
LAISPGMKSRIRTGQYEFPNPEWQNVSTAAKELIKGMLNVEPENRMSIEQVMRNTWIDVNCIFPKIFTCDINFIFEITAIHRCTSDTIAHGTCFERG